MLIRPPVAADIPALVGVFSDWGHPQPAQFIATRLELWAATPHLARSGSFGRLVGLAVAGSFLGYEDRSDRQARSIRTL